MHGANRLGGNSLSDLLVFGRLAGVGVDAYIKAQAGAPVFDQVQADAALKRTTEILNREEGTNPFLLHEELQDIMQQHVGIVREKAELEAGIEKLQALKLAVEKVKAAGASQYNAGWHEAIDLSSLVITAEAAARAALLREESRGAHTRLDFEGEREEWGQVNIIVGKDGTGEMSVRKEQRPEPPTELSDIAHASLEDLEGSTDG
jgi:succinate dehydrogenase / fumarate reductase flavoprotein subunit